MRRSSSDSAASRSRSFRNPGRPKLASRVQRGFGWRPCTQGALASAAGYGHVPSDKPRLPTPTTYATAHHRYVLRFPRTNGITPVDMSCLENHARSHAGLECLFPAENAEAPAVARFQAGKAVHRIGSTQVIPTLLGEAQELGCHFRADQVQAQIRWSRVAASVPIEASSRTIRAGLEFGPQNVLCGRHVGLPICEG
jgi:hypothetical protein